MDLTSKGYLEALANKWAEGLAGVMQSMADVRPDLVCAASSDIPDVDLLWWEQRVDVSSEPVAWVGASEALWRDFGERTLQSAGISEVSLEDARSTYQEILSQAMAVLARSLSGDLGAEVNCEAGNEVKSAGPGTIFRLNVEITGTPIAPLWLVLNLAYINAPPGEEESASSPGQGTVADGAAGNVVASKNLDLLYDVELPVTISFGRAQLMIKDVLKLTTGSIVELNRGVSEPVEVIVNNCVVARGEVVVVEGNYGVRIQQIISRQDRIRTAHR